MELTETIVESCLIVITLDWNIRNTYPGKCLQHGDGDTNPGIIELWAEVKGIIGTVDGNLLTAIVVVFPLLA